MPAGYFEELAAKELALLHDVPIEMARIVISSENKDDDYGLNIGLKRKICLDFLEKLSEFYDIIPNGE